MQPAKDATPAESFAGYFCEDVAGTDLGVLRVVLCCEAPLAAAQLSQMRAKLCKL